MHLTLYMICAIMKKADRKEAVVFYMKIEYDGRRELT